MTAATRSTRGLFILFEGIDRCGKTTQAKKLVEYFNQKGQAHFMRFPNRDTTIGQTINDYLMNKCEMDDHAIHLLFSANRWEAASTLKKHLADGHHVVVDRYSYSGAAFSAAKPGITLDWCMQPEQGLPKPDCIIYLDMSVEQTKERAQFGDERYEKEQFQKLVRVNFFELMKSSGLKWNILDATKSIEELHQEIIQIAQACVSQLDQTNAPLDIIFNK